MITGKKDQRKPLTKGAAKVPVVMQLEAVECGAASLTMILHYYRKWIPLEQVRLDCGVSRDGSSAKNILRAARSYGLTAKGWRMEPEALLASGPFPCIIHWGFNHFVVLCGFKGKRAVLNDPVRGNVTVEWEEFDRLFTGVCLTFEPGENFAETGKKRSALDYAKERLKGSGTAAVFVMQTAVLAALLALFGPVFSRVFMDRLLSRSNPSWLRPFMLAYFAFALLTVFVSWISALYSFRLQGKLTSMGNVTYLWKVLRLPMQFFEQRIPADIADRQNSSVSIAAALVNTFGPLLIDTAMMIVYLVIILRYSVVLALIGAGSLILNLILDTVISNRRANITRVRQRDSAKLNAVTVSGIGMIETIKASGAEKGYFQRWSGCQASMNRQNIRSRKVEVMLGALPALVTALANVLVLGGGVYYMVNGKFTIGMLTAFQGFLAAFLTPADLLPSAGRSLQEMMMHMERVDDVMRYPQDPCFEEKEKTQEYEKLSGTVELKNVTFGYSALNEPLIRDFSMSVKPGMKIAIVGKSGCGKSTFAKLMAQSQILWDLGFLS